MYATVSRRPRTGLARYDITPETHTDFRQFRRLVARVRVVRAWTIYWYDCLTLMLPSMIEGPFLISSQDAFLSRVVLVFRALWEGLPVSNETRKVTDLRTHARQHSEMSCTWHLVLASRVIDENVLRITDKARAGGRGKGAAAVSGKELMLCSC